MPFTRSAQIGITIAAVLAVALLFVAIREQPSDEVIPTVSTTVETSSTYLVATTTTVTQLSQESREVLARPIHITETEPSTTTTSEIPPPLTPEQEACIPVEGEVEPSGCEHMPAQDFDLPSETTTSIDFVETPAT